MKNCDRGPENAARGTPHNQRVNISFLWNCNLVESLPTIIAVFCHKVGTHMCVNIYYITQFERVG